MSITGILALLKVIKLMISALQSTNERVKRGQLEGVLPWPDGIIAPPCHPALSCRTDPDLGVLFSSGVKVCCCVNIQQLQ